jgi:serine protease Do
MNPRFRVWVIYFWALAGLPHGQLRARESIPESRLEELKAATAFIKVAWPSLSGSATGFVVRVDGDTGYIVTNHHVIQARAVQVNTRPRSEAPSTPPRAAGTRSIQVRLESPSKIVLVFGSGTNQERTADAEVVADDPSHDLAILKVKGFKNLPKPISVDRMPKLLETKQVFVFGFPFGAELAAKLGLGQGSPAITVGTGTISSLRRDSKDQLVAVQIDGAINPGNSGGPIVDSDGLLVGVAKATVRGSGIGVAIPGAEVSKLFDGRIEVNRMNAKRATEEKVDIEVDARVIDPLERFKAVSIHFNQPANPELTYEPDPSGAWAELPNASHVDLTLHRLNATGTFQMKDERRSFPVHFQFSAVDKQNVRIFTPPRRANVKLNGGAPAAPAKAARDPLKPSPESRPGSSNPPPS